VFEDDFAFHCTPEVARNRIDFIRENIGLAPVWLGDWIVNGPQPLQHSVFGNVKMVNGA
jgi:hypothetical protein